MGVIADLPSTSRPAIAQTRLEVLRMLQESTVDQEDIFWTLRERYDDVGAFKPQRRDLIEQRIIRPSRQGLIDSTLVPGGHLTSPKLVVISRCSYCIGQRYGKGRSTGTIAPALARACCESLLRKLREQFEEGVNERTLFTTSRCRVRIFQGSREGREE